MFRMQIHQLPQTDGILEYTIKNKKGMDKMLKIYPCENSDSQKEEAVHMLQIKCRELTRDCLYQLYGDKWRSMEDKHKKQINKSISSAIRRMG